MVHEAHWERLATAEPEEVCRRTGVQYDPDRHCYTLPLLNRYVEVDPQAWEVRWSGGDPQADTPPRHDVALVAVVYLNEAKELEPTGEWVTGESLPAGAFFFRGLHALPTGGVVNKFGRDAEGFLKAGRALGGEEAEGGDACIQFQALPRIPMRLVLWLGDDEFPARLTILLDRLASAHNPLDAILPLSKFVTTSLIMAPTE